jgi:hypothetical protein
MDYSNLDRDPDSRDTESLDTTINTPSINLSNTNQPPISVQEKRKPGRKKGCVKTGGRQKGTTNRNEKFLTDKLRKMYGKDFDPIMRAAEMAVEIHSVALETKEMADMVQAVNCWDKIAQYIQPKLKAIEIQTDNKSARQIRDVTINVVSTQDSTGIEQAAKSLIKDIN